MRALSAKFEQLAKNPEQRRDVRGAPRADLRPARSPDVAGTADAAGDVVVLLALGIFVATSVAIALVAAVAHDFTWVAVGLGMVGAFFMLYGSVLLVIESRMALGAILSEMDFVWKVSQRYAGKDLAAKSAGGPFTWLGKKIG